MAIKKVKLIFNKQHYILENKSLETPKKNVVKKTNFQ